MRRPIRMILAASLACGLCATGQLARADEPGAVLDRAIKAMGGEENLRKAKTATWKAKGVISFMGNDSPMEMTFACDGLDRFRQEFDAEFGGNKVHGVTILNGEKGVRSFSENRRELDKQALADTKRTAYLNLIPITILPLKDKAFKLEPVPDEMVMGRAVVGIKVTPPDGKEFTLYFDKEKGLPAKLVAKVAGFMGNEFTQETIFTEYGEMAGIKKAIKSKSTRNGEKFIEQEVTEFKVQEKADPKAFSDV